MPSDLVVSNVDTAAAIFDVASIAPPSEYVLDGLPYVQRVLDVLGDEESALTPHELDHSDYRFVDIFNSRSLISAQYQYIFRANQVASDKNGVFDQYPAFTTRSSCTTSPRTRTSA